MTNPVMTDRVERLREAEVHLLPDRMVIDPDAPGTILILGDDSPVEGKIVCDSRAEAKAIMEVAHALPALLAVVEALEPFARAYTLAQGRLGHGSLAEVAALAAYHVEGSAFRNAINALSTMKGEG